MLGSGVKVGIGVDGSASNDGSHMLAEARLAMLLSRLDSGLKGASLSGQGAPPLMTARTSLEISTRGGAAVLGRSDIGSLSPGFCADFISVDLNRLAFAGALHDPLAALVFCAPVNVDYNVVAGKKIVEDGRINTVDLPNLITQHNNAAQRLLSN